MSPSSLTAHALAAEIAARRLSPVDVVDDHLSRIERLEPALQAFTAVWAKEARLAAEAADKAIRAGHAVGPLHGVPIAVKDLVDVEGTVTMGGTAAWRSRISPRTATLYRKLMAAGLICLGKTHTVEFAYGGWVSARPISQGLPQCLMDDHGDAPVPPSWPAITTWSALHLATPAAIVPTPISDTSLTLMSECGATFFRSWMS
jgi:hypothetical protein